MAKSLDLDPSSNTLATDANSWLIRKDPDAGKDWRQEEKRVTEDEMAGWHHRCSGHVIAVVWSLSHVQLFVTPWARACQASLSFTTSRNLLRLLSTELVMPSNHLMSLSKLQVLVKEREVCCREVCCRVARGVTESQTWLSDWTRPLHYCELLFILFLHSEIPSWLLDPDFFFFLTHSTLP